MKLLVSISALSLSGNLFHKIGAADANAWSPYVQVDEVGGKLLTVCWRSEDFFEVWYTSPKQKPHDFVWAVIMELFVNNQVLMRLSSLPQDSFSIQTHAQVPS